MDASEALTILQILADGVDPQTGEVFPDDSTFQHPQTIRALFVAIRALEESEQRRKRDERRKIEKHLPENAGKPWERTEDEEVCRDFDAGMTVKQISEKHKRTEGAIQSRLERLGKIQLP